MKKISIVVPCYNEQEGVKNFFEVLCANLSEIEGYEYELIAVNDGSKDGTLTVLKEIKENRDNFVIVNLSRNFGHEAAVAAGMSVASGDALIVMDSDLQDPPEIIKELVKKYEEGYDVVNAKRASRKSDTFFKRNTAKLFYKIIAKWSGKVKVPENVGHFRIMSRRVVDHVVALNDFVRVLRVEVPYVGFKTATVEFERKERQAGKTHYNIKSMTTLALDSIVSTSGEPLKLISKWTIVEALLFLLSSFVELVLFIISCCGVHLGISNVGFVGWLIINVLMLLTFFIMLGQAINAEYMARLYSEVQHRPFFIIESVDK